MKHLKTRQQLSESTENDVKSLILNIPTKESITEYLIKNYDEYDILSNIDDAMLDFIDSDWADEYSDEYEAYAETGRGEAESQVRMEIEKDILKILNLSYEDYCEIVGEDVWTTIIDVFSVLEG